MAKKNVYQLQYCYEAPDLVKTKQLGYLVTEYFDKDEMVIGEVFEKHKIIVEDRFIIPLDYVEKSDKFPYLKKDSQFDETISKIKEQAIALGDRKEQNLDKTSENVKDVIEGKTKIKINSESKAYRNGAVLGLGGGVLLALYLRKNIWMFGLIGVAIGGYVAHKIHNAKKGKNNIN
jgi:hypothetical protein